MKQFKLLNIETNEIVVMTLNEILENINRDRSENWTPYDSSDWIEGLHEFTEFKLIGGLKHETT